MKSNEENIYIVNIYNTIIQLADILVSVLLPIMMKITTAHFYRPASLPGNPKHTKQLPHLLEWWKRQERVWRYMGRGSKRMEPMWIGTEKTKGV